MEQFNQPLADRLRSAAIGRSESGSEQVDDDFVLDPDGVIDLRELRKINGRSIAAPAAALATIRGQLGDAAEISSLYDESEPVPRWRLGLRARHAFGVKTIPETVADTDTVPSLSVVADVIDLTADTADMVSETTLPDETVLEETVLDEAVLDEAVLDETVLDETVLEEAVLDETVLDETVLDETVLEETVLDETESADDTESVVDDTNMSLDDEDRPQAECPRCLRMGQRDLFDRFSQIEFYSCDGCHNMWQQELS